MIRTGDDSDDDAQLPCVLQIMSGKRGGTCRLAWCTKILVALAVLEDFRQRLKEFIVVGPVSRTVLSVGQLVGDGNEFLVFQQIPHLTRGNVTVPGVVKLVAVGIFKNQVAMSIPSVGARGIVVDIIRGPFLVSQRLVLPQAVCDK